MGKIWCGSYNVGNEIPGDTEIQHIINTIPGGTDLVVFGLQEGKKIPDVFRKFHKFLGSNYLSIGVKEMTGMTKVKEGLNGQGITAFAMKRACRGESGISLGYSDEETVMFSERTMRAGAEKGDKLGKKIKKTLTRPLSLIAGKGGVGVVVGWGAKKVGFVSVHMGTNVKNHSAEYAGIFQTANNRIRSEATYQPCLGGLVVMGDVNIRLTKLPSRVATPVGLLNELMNPVSRDELLRLNETDIRNTWLCSEKHFDFPIPLNGSTGEVAFPTYKRKVGQCGPSNQIGEALMKKLMTCYELKSLQGKHGSGPEIGWLDRIAYKSNLNAPGVQFANAVVRTIPQVAMSDHTPVYMTAEVNT